MTIDLEHRVSNLLRMDKVVRCVNDEESGIIEWWLSEGLPDGYTVDACIEYAMDDTGYLALCESWSSRISKLIAEGYWRPDGHTAAFFNLEACK